MTKSTQSQPATRDHSSRAPRQKRALPPPRMSHLGAVEKAARTKLLKDAVFVVFDIESTGGNPERNGITEICALKVVNGELTDRFYTLVNPQVRIPPIVRRMTGIDNKMVSNAPKIDEVMPEFVDFVKGTVLVSHNTIGDLKFLRYYSKKVMGEEINNFFLCTHLLVERLVEEAPNRSLKGLAQHFRFSARGEVHRADADAYLTLDLFRELLARLAKRNIETLADAIRLQADYESGMRLGWSVPVESYKTLPDSPGVFELRDRRSKLHFFSAAANLRRDFDRFQKLEQLPKQLIRTVLSSYEFKWNSHPSILSALLEESRTLTQHPKLPRPSMWHQRGLQAICIKAVGRQCEIYTGEPTAGVIAMYAPIGDRKQIGVFINQVAQALELENAKTLMIPQYLRGLVCEYLSGRLELFSDRLTQRRKNPLRWLMPGNLKHLHTLANFADRLGKIALPKGLIAVSEMKGVILMRTSPANTYDCFRVRYGVLSKDGQYQGKLQDYLKTGPARLRRHLNYLKGNKGLHRPLSAAEANQASAAFWWLFGHTRSSDGTFFSDSELRSVD